MLRKKINIFQEFTDVHREYYKMKKAEVKDKTKQGLTYKLRVLTRKQDGKTGGQNLFEGHRMMPLASPSILMYLKFMLLKRLPLFYATTTDYSFDTGFSDSDDSPKFKVRGTCSSSSEHASKTLSVTKCRNPLVMNPSPKEMHVMTL